MIRPMDGVRVLEVAQFTFMPAAGAVLADWGADVIKVEHAVTGDAQRGLSALIGCRCGSGSFAPLMEHPNRGKRSIGLALEQPEALDVLHELIRTQRRVPDQLPPRRAPPPAASTSTTSAQINPDIIYVRGIGFGATGPDSEKGGYDGTAFWARAGSAPGPPRRTTTACCGCRPAPTATRSAG